MHTVLILLEAIIGGLIGGLFVCAAIAFLKYKGE